MNQAQNMPRVSMTDLDNNQPKKAAMIAPTTPPGTPKK